MCMAAMFAMTMTGCGKEKSEKVPELMEPVSTNEAYRPVTYGDIGRKVIKTGTIVPTDYSYYYETSATLSKVYVNVGDEVKKVLFLLKQGTVQMHQGETTPQIHRGETVDLLAMELTIHQLMPASRMTYRSTATI